MFTGIVTDVGTVRKAEQRGDHRLTIDTSYDIDGVDLGGSIACSGVGLTVVDKGDDWFAVDVSAETLSQDRARSLARRRAAESGAGPPVGRRTRRSHRHRPLDAVAAVVGTCPEGDLTRLGIRVPRRSSPMIARQGFDHARRCLVHRQRGPR